MNDEKKLVIDYPYSPDTHYNYGLKLEEQKNYIKAFEEYNIAHILAGSGYKCGFDLTELYEHIDFLGNWIIEQSQNEDSEISKDDLIYIATKNKYYWEVTTNPFHLDVPIEENIYRDYYELGKLYMAAYGATENWKLEMHGGEGLNPESRKELQRTSDVCRELYFEADVDCYVPIVSDERMHLLVKNDEEEHEVFHRQKDQFINYRIPKGKNCIQGSGFFRVGEIVPAIHVDERKKLVLNIFIDGLTQSVLGSNFESNMPNTYRFFSNGMSCNNMYTTADWTYPSMASIHTGQASPHHKMLHPDILRKIDIETSMLAEYFKAAGYNTSKFGGNWRITPNYGYARGMNRTIYQHHYCGYWAESIVSDVIEQIHNMRDTDQFIFMELIELHTVADNIGLGNDVSNVPLDKNYVPVSMQETSVKQEYCESQKAFYLEEVKKVDRKLSTLYHFIEENYQDDEILVTLISDHGQGFLVEPDKDFFADERSRVPFMIRGTNQRGVSEELMSVCDYSAILCKEAGIVYQYENTDASLPKTFGGSEERDFVVTESIHPGDSYQMRITGKTFDFYLHSEKPVSDDCRVDLSKIETFLVDKDGETIVNEEFCETCIEFCKDHLGTCLAEA